MKNYAELVQRRARHLILRRSRNIVGLISLISFFIVVFSPISKNDDSNITEVVVNLENIANNNQSIINQVNDAMKNFTSDLTDHVILTKEPKRILYWWGFYSIRDLGFGFGNPPFVKNNCKVTNCWTTDDRSWLNRSDAVIFHVLHFNRSDLPTYRLPHQRYIFFMYESMYVHFRLNPTLIPKNYFNWTMTHRRDSDIYVANIYGALRRKPSSLIQQQLPAYLPKGVRSPLKIVHHQKLFPNKTKLVAWYCSHRDTYGGREDYIKELSKHIQVDIYGACGNMTCLPVYPVEICNKKLNEYKFYLAAENSLCPDYVTEKFYKALEYNVVPIVYGGADYSHYAPPHSYIHVGDFKSPKDLANYLLFLDQHDGVYAKYFEWKNDWEVVNHPKNGFCDLCEKLNDPKEEIKSYDRVVKWWFDDVPCPSGKSYLNLLNAVPHD